MATYYCKESSLQALAAAIKNGAGIASATKLAVNQFAAKIRAFVIPTSRGSPIYTLDTTKTSQAIQRGKYTGGSVSVTTEIITATLTAGGSTVSPASGKVIEKVIIPARDDYLSKCGTFTPGANNTFSITNLTFKPVGIVMYASVLSGAKQPQLVNFSWVNGEAKGTAVSNSIFSGAPVTSASVSTTNSSISISNVVATANGSSFNCTWQTKQWTYFVWG